MVNYVNTVLVGKGAAALAADTFDNGDLVKAASADTNNNGKFVIVDAETGLALSASTIVGKNAIKVGYITDKTVRGINGKTFPVVKWSNVIKRNEIKSFSAHTATSSDGNTEDTVYIDLSGITASTIAGNKRVLVRITYKDMPTRYRKWTDTYEYLTKADDSAAKIAAGIADVIKRDWKRSRVEVKVGVIDTTSTDNTGVVGGGKYFHADADQDNTTHAVIQIKALPYTDDDAIDTINVANKIRFNANLYYTDPQAAGFASKNKYAISGAKITKVPGLTYAGDWKLVRDHEAQAMGYEGILNRGEGTWPIIKPAMETVDNAKYSYLTLEFETMYRAADDIQRHTKECLEVFDIINTNGADSTVAFPVKDAIEAWIDNNVTKDNIESIIADYNTENGITGTI